MTTTALMPPLAAHLVQEELVRRLHRCVSLDLALSKVLTQINQEENPVTENVTGMLLLTRRMVRKGIFSCLADILDYGSEAIKRRSKELIRLSRRYQNQGLGSMGLPFVRTTEITRFMMDQRSINRR